MAWGLYPLTTAKYYYLGNHVVARDDKNGSVDTVTCVHTDALGSPIATTNASKAILGTTTYLPYGGLYASTGTGNQAGIHYAGHYADPTGLVYMHARYYDPQMHRFISTDPMDIDTATALNVNRYSYANNSPYAKYDPSGRESNCVMKSTCAGEGTGETFADTANSIASELGDAVDGMNQLAMTMGPAGVELMGAEELGGITAEKVGQAAVDVANDVKAVFGLADETAPLIKSGSSGGESAGSAFPQSVRRAAFEENPGTCVYCRMETESPQADHAIPRARGGNATIDNAQTTCPWCNASKGARDYPVNPPPGYRGDWPPPWWGQ